MAKQPETETSVDETAQGESEKDRGPYGPFYLMSRVRSLFPPDETLIEFERHIIRSQIELLQGVRTIVDSYLSRLEHREKHESPKRVSKIEITDADPAAGDQRGLPS